MNRRAVLLCLCLFWVELGGRAFAGNPTVPVTVEAADLFDAMQTMSRMVILDCRSRTAYLEAHIEGALWAADWEARQGEKAPSPGALFVVYDGNGRGEGPAYLLARRLGRNGSCAWVLEGGFADWAEKSYPVRRVISQSSDTSTDP
jgi:rhodanese-related sulfurtransferase